jgi:hypothetical protein
MSHSIQSELPEKLHSDVVLGRDSSFPRARAINLVPTARMSDAVPLLRQVMENDAEEIRYRRLAAISLWRLNTAEAREALLAAAATTREPSVLGAVVKCLGRVGDDRALAALESLARQADGPLVQQVAFASALIAYRLGLPGRDLAIPAPSEGVPRISRGRIELAAPSDDEAKLFADGLRDEPYDIELDKGSLWQVRCPAGLWMLALSAPFVAARRRGTLGERKAVIGLVASKNSADGRYSVAYLVFSAPREKGGELDLLIHRATGEVAWAGAFKDGGEGPIEFAVHAAGRIGIAAIEMAGTWSSAGGIELTRAISAALVTEKQNPVPVAAPRAAAV